MTAQDMDSEKKWQQQIRVEAERVHESATLCSETQFEYAKRWRCVDRWAGRTVAVRGGRQEKRRCPPSPLPIYTAPGACGKPPVVPHNHRSHASAYGRWGERNACIGVDVSGWSVAMNERRENQEPTYDTKGR
jgi:hypothetical protein